MVATSLKNDESPSKNQNAKNAILNVQAAGPLTRRASRARIASETGTRILDRRPVPGANFSRTEALDDPSFFQLVERLARLSLVDFIAVFQAARYRRRFGEKKTYSRRREEVYSRPDRASR